MGKGSPIVFESLTPFIQFPPSLAALLRVNEEIPFDFSNQQCRLTYKTREDIENAQEHFSDKLFSSPSHSTSAKFANYRTTTKRFSNVFLAISHCLYGSAGHANGVIHALRAHLLGDEVTSEALEIEESASTKEPIVLVSDEMLKASQKKNKISLDFLFRALTKANQSTVDVVVLSPKRDYASVYTSFAGHRIDEQGRECASDGHSAESAAPNRIAVILEHDEAKGTWSPVHYSSQRGGTEPAAIAPLPGPPVTENVGKAPPVPPLALKSTRVATAPPALPPPAKKPAAPVEKDFLTVVQSADQRYHPPSGTHQQRLVTSAFLRLSAADNCNVIPGYDMTGQSLANGNVIQPFAKLRYPNLDMSDGGVILLTAAAVNYGAFPRTCCRFTLSLLSGLAVLGLAVALMAYLWSTGIRQCCNQSSNLLDVCWDGNSSNVNSSFHEQILRDEGICIVEMCNPEGEIAQDAIHAFLFGSILSIGRLVWLVIIGSLLSVFFTAGVNFFTMRTLALEGSTPRFAFWLTVLHVLVAAATSVAAAYLLFVTTRMRGAPVEHVCSWYSGSTALLCLRAQTACETTVSLFFDNGVVPVAITASIVPLMGVHLIVSLISAQPSDDERANIVHAIPDTNIFSRGRYAPDGIDTVTKHQIQEQIVSELVQRGTKKISMKAVSQAKKAVAMFRRRLAARKAAVKVGPADGSVAELFEDTPRPDPHADDHRELIFTKFETGRHQSFTFRPSELELKNPKTVLEIERIAQRVKDTINSNPSTLLHSTPGASPHPVHDGGDALPSARPPYDKHTLVEAQLAMMEKESLRRDRVVNQIVARIATRHANGEAFGGDDSALKPKSDYVAEEFGQVVNESSGDESHDHEQ